MKKLAALFLTMIMLFGMATAVQASTTPVTVTIDGEAVPFGDQQPIKENGTTLVPVRILAEKLGFELEWNDKSRTVTVSESNATISLEIGKKTAIANGTTQLLPVAPKIINKVAYAPLRFIVEELGLHLTWDAATNAVAIETADKSHGFLWQAEHNGNTVYMLGSIHTATKEMYPLRDALLNAFAEAEHLSVEVNVLDENQNTEALLDELGYYKDGSTLKDDVSEETYLALGELLTALGYESNALDGVKPWLATTTLTNLSTVETDYDWDMGIDYYFMQEAVKRGLPIVELESLQLQIEMFAGFSPELQEKQLIEAISGFYSETDNLNDFTDMWRAGDLEHLTRLTEEVAEDEEYYNALLKNRNHGMADKIEAYLQNDGSKTYFVIVGALHLAGEDGLVTLLEQMGYTVTRI